MPETRPPIDQITSATELRRWYWLKSELVAAARAKGVRTQGGKFTILDRLAHHLETGELIWPGDTKPKTSSSFDWATETLTPQTILTDSYKNNQNVRAFFQAHADPKFKFSTPFMAWIKANTGRTLADAIAEYHRLMEARAAPGYRSEILHHNQFNQYTRDFLADNPEADLDTVRHFWRLKRMRPSEDGRHVYASSDLDLSEGD
ncbi:MAG: DUF6434 domain-containing protein [Pseudomonadota bacterium]